MTEGTDRETDDLLLKAPNPAWQFRCDIWDLILAHIDDLDVDEMRATLEDILYEYYDLCGAGKPDA